jgi:hypothetical protein
MPSTETLNSSVNGMQTSGSVRESTSHPRRISPALVFLASLALASAADHLLASWLEFSPPPRGYIGAYRRVGLEAGPQVFCAGSSLTVAALYWSEVSQTLGQGIETWSVAGSSPDIWEEWQQQSPRSTTTIIGISVYDLNEMHVAPDRANIVPLSQTISDLWSSHADSGLSHRLLTQYAFRYVRLFFPTAGNSDRVLVAVRARVADLLGRQVSLGQHEGVVVEPSPPALAAGESSASVSDWSSGRLLRRIAVLRDENRGRHEFSNGPKRRAFQRMLLRARQRGRVIVAVLPVAREYIEAFLDENAVAAFEREIHDVTAIAPEATVIRLDRVPGISNPSYFLDLAHMNSQGRRVATDAFLTEVTHGGSQRMLDATPSASMSSSK